MAIPIAWICAMGTTSIAPPRIVITLLVAVHAALAGLVLMPEVALPTGPAKRQGLPEFIGQLLSFPVKFRDDSPITTQQLDNARIYLFGTATPYYYRGRVFYHTVFDNDPLLAAIRADLRDPTTLATRQYLVDLNINYLIVNYDEIERLADTYGFGQPALRDKKHATEFRSSIERTIEFAGFIRANPHAKPNEENIELAGEPGTVVYQVTPAK
jgi:hypothetical protein